MGSTAEAALAGTSEAQADSGGEAARRRGRRYLAEYSARTAETRDWRGHASANPSRSTAQRIRSGDSPTYPVRIPAQRLWCCILSAVALFALVTGALGQVSGRYDQPENVAQKAGFWHIRVQSVDVFPDKKVKVHLIVTNRQAFTNELYLTDIGKIQFISDSLERVAGVGKPEGQFMLSGNKVGSTPGIAFAANDSIRLSLNFPAFREATKTAKLVFYPGSINDLGVAAQIENIALYTGQ